MIRRQSFYLDAERPGNTAAAALETLKAMLHFNAKEELTLQVCDVIRIWLENRFSRLGLEVEDRGEAVLNPWNGKGLGLQSVSLRVLREAKGRADGKNAVLLPDEWKSPTIGVVTPGLINGEVMTGETTFGINEGDTEEITPFTHDLLMDAQKEGIISARVKGQPLIVHGPDAVRTYIEMPKDKVDPDKLRDVVHRAVYACRFLNTPKV